MIIELNAPAPLVAMYAIIKDGHAVKIVDGPCKPGQEGGFFHMEEAEFNKMIKNHQQKAGKVLEFK
jgi:hypothetical protein